MEIADSQYIQVITDALHLAQVAILGLNITERASITVTSECWSLGEEKYMIYATVMMDNGEISSVISSSDRIFSSSDKILGSDETSDVEGSDTASESGATPDTFIPDAADTPVDSYSHEPNDFVHDEISEDSEISEDFVVSVNEMGFSIDKDSLKKLGISDMIRQIPHPDENPNCESRLNKIWTEEEINFAIFMRAAGMDLDSIWHRLWRSGISVRDRLLYTFGTTDIESCKEYIAREAAP